MAKRKIKAIEANAKNSDVIHRIENFASRFNIESSVGNKQQFQNRCISAINDYIGDGFTYINQITSEVFHLLGLPYKPTGGFYFSDSELYKLLEHEKLSLNQWLLILECILNIKLQINYKVSTLAMRIAESLKLSGINAVLCETSDGYMFYPANAELLDHKIVIDVLNWLSDYPKAKEQYNQALRMFLKGDMTRHIIDSVRLSFELFLKQYFNNQTSIENQSKTIGQSLKDNNVSVEIRNMFLKLIDCFAVYNNQHIKHNDDSEIITESEIEFLIYLTGSFIRFMIQLKKETTNIGDASCG